nr:hypothetical protein [uncultured Prevotella sp.]
MERKIGEIFEYQGKTYKVAEFDDCRNCAFIHINCSSLRSIIGNCMDFLRNDGANVKFEEVKDMEIKDNKLTINIPDGMEIDLQNSNFDTCVIKFRKKELTYKDIQDSVGKYPASTFVTPRNWLKINATNMLIDIAKYYNGNWEPHWESNELKYYITFSFVSNSYSLIERCHASIGPVFFKSKKDAQAVIDNPNFREILDAIYKN